MFLTACENTKQAPTVCEGSKVPEPLLTCIASPIIPEMKAQSDVADYILDLWNAGEDCRQKLAQVKKLQEAQVEVRM